VAARMALFLAGLLLIATAVSRIVLHHGAAPQ
jgi:hypothetical protein